MREFDVHGIIALNFLSAFILSTAVRGGLGGAGMVPSGDPVRSLCQESPSGVFVRRVSQDAPGSQGPETFF